MLLILNQDKLLWWVNSNAVNPDRFSVVSGVLILVKYRLDSLVAFSARNALLFMRQYGVCILLCL